MDRDSYWHMALAERTALKMPRSFDQALKQKFGGDRAIDPGNIIQDTSTTSVPRNETTSKSTENPTLSEQQTYVGNDSSDVREVSPSDIPSSTGKKRGRLPWASAMRRDLHETTRELYKKLVANNLKQMLDYKNEESLLQKIVVQH